MALEGSLSDFGLADILQLIYFQRKTGVLTLDGKLDRVKLQFADGNITGAESRRRIEDNRLGKILIKKGLITETVLQSALSEQKEGGERLGTVLIKKGLVSKNALGEIINSQITETVVQLFSWKEGTYEFKALPVAIDKELSFSLDTQQLLMEGLRIVDEWAVIKGRITLDMVFARLEDFPEILSSDEREIFEFVDGENDVSTIIDLSDRDNFEVSKTLLSLVEKGVIKTVEAAPILTEAELIATERREARRRLPVLSLLTPAAVVLSLFLALSSLVAARPVVFKTLRTANEIEVLRLKIEAYRIEHSSYPPSLDIISGANDSWRRPYVYRLLGDSYLLSSLGPDGKEGTADDIY